MYSFPLTVGNLSIGALELFDRRPHVLDLTRVAEIEHLGRLVGRTLLVRGLERAAEQGDTAGTLSAFSRREIHQATGMIIAQAGVTPEDAALLLRSRAYSSGHSVADLARQVVDRSVTCTNSTIELEGPLA